MPDAELMAVCERPKKKRNRKPVAAVQGPVCVDSNMIEFLMSRSWHRSPQGYVRRTLYLGNYRREVMLLHRVIVGAVAGQIVDHVSGDILDNRRCNLRVCTAAENTMNARRTGATTLMKGVKQTRSGRFVAQCASGGSRESLGTFDTAEEAALAYNEAAKRMHGDFARLNTVALADRLREGA